MPTPHTLISNLFQGRDVCGSTIGQLLQLTSLYGTLAKFYEHIDPEKHIYFYQKHFMFEKQLVQLYWQLHGTMD